ncbi:hypothetical protein [Streptomyces sp. URMC 124]|uniref:hypothetical protein n=1 Tax=Streptomyces sp. URMC 124 TaxID=3423405 RepID=UPI003F1A28CD
MTISLWTVALFAAGLAYIASHDAIERRRRDRRVAAVREARIRDEAALGIHDITAYLDEQREAGQ